MASQPKISFSAKFLSLRHYLDDVSVDGQLMDPTQRKWGNYDKYVTQAIRAGNCITLLRESYPMTAQSFWNITHFEKFARSVFWKPQFLSEYLGLVDLTHLFRRSSLAFATVDTTVAIRLSNSQEQIHQTMNVGAPKPWRYLFTAGHGHIF